MKRLTGVLVAALICMLIPPVAANAEMLNPAGPASPVKLIFIHHSTGENWLDDANGGLGVALLNNNYFVSDTNYGWGPDTIGSTTDIGHWWSWFRGPSSASYMTALYAENGQNCSYSRLTTEPAGPNEIVMFKSCFPNSALGGSPSDAVPAIDVNPLRNQACGDPGVHTVANAKGIYMDLLNYFDAHQETLFIVIAAPPLQSATYSSNARAFNNWLAGSWLSGYGHDNVFVFDFYNVLTTNGGSAGTNDLGSSDGNHHRFIGGAIQHKTDGDHDANPNVLEYPSSSGDDHPSRAGNLKATAEFVPLLNVAYNRWKGIPGTDTVGPVTYAPRGARVRRYSRTTLYYKAADLMSSTATTTIKIKKRGGYVVKTFSLGARTTNVLQHYHFGCSLARGTYYFYVYARDLSGNAQIRAGWNVLTVY